MSIRTILARIGIVRDDLTPLEETLIRLAAHPPPDRFEPVLFEAIQQEKEEE